ncbi:ABC transporter ATP-binding protein [Streptacidiphilus sp. P02-A3a]|uniref:dipeptide ABC transporter ATP-binding protein n=1 Tax=Streptacidiphilus sp. P02-A3a TaxID=2704468 RepID=UPI0015FC00B7|nr:ABC transporter ATP-binding protein [Streptacidiphilus sp. P02-A3a]QMU71677.1 ABC transporter ATP-binding protein [Streptacidiphilus sp. P02-A3a]
MSTPLLQVRDLEVSFHGPRGPVPAVQGLGFDVPAGETVGIVGESGSGKSTTALALMGMLPGTGRITGGQVLLEGRDLVTATPADLRDLRGRRVSMIFQDPVSALNPVLSIGRHLDEALRAHGTGDRGSRRRRALELLDLVGIPDPSGRIDDHPHQFSGGQRQRVMIALALANEPAVLLADEPTTALDATVQEQILDLLDKVNRETGTAIVLITHNLGVVARSCRRTLVMYAGRIIEDGPTELILTHPQHPYTEGLLAAVPRIDAPSGTRLRGVPGIAPDPGATLSGCSFADRCGSAEDLCRSQRPELTGPHGGSRAACWRPGSAPLSLTAPRAAAPGPVAPGTPTPPADTEPPLLEVRDLRKSFARRGRARRLGPLVALDGVSLSLRAGETLGVVGESGSGKSTLVRTLLRVHEPDAGSVLLRGREVTARTRDDLLREVQLVFQDPYASLNPRMTAGQIIAEPLIAQGVRHRGEREHRVAELLEQVGLDRSAADRRPGAFSGGQRQRIGIARALAPRPSILICDEPVSALDVSVQAQVLNLLLDLQRDLGLAIVFIAHDLAVVRQVSHRIAVMRQGRIVETGDADRLVTAPREEYTRTLLAAVPTLAAHSPAAR